MFDIGGWEFLVIAVIGIVVIGPKDLPAALRTARKYIRRARELAAEFRSGIDEVVREVELDEVKNEIKSAIDVDELTEMGESLKGELTADLDLEGELQSALDFDHDHEIEQADEPRILDDRGGPKAAVAEPFDDQGDDPGENPGDEGEAAPRAGPAVGS